MPTDSAEFHMRQNLTPFKSEYQRELRGQPADIQSISVMIDAMTFAKRLKEARKAAGLTQQQLADACGLTNAAISKWEAGQTEALLANNLFAVADVLRVDPRWLATGQGDPKNGLKGLTDEQRAAVQALISAIKK